MGGRFSNNEHQVIPVDGVDNITQSMKRIVEAVAEFVETSGWLLSFYCLVLVGPAQCKFSALNGN